MRKQFTLALLGLSISCILFGAGVMHSIDSMNWHKFKPESVVTYLYTYICDECGYELAEGDYSFSVENGYEFCPMCGADRQFDHFEESSLYHNHSERK